MTPARIRSMSVPPPGGEFFYEVGGERITGRIWLTFRPRVVELMTRHGVVGIPEDVVAECMCPHMPDWYCEGVFGSRPVRMSEAKETAREYFSRQVVPFDETSRRLRICSSCPKHSRSVCLTCTGALNWIGASFGNRRTQVPEDRLSGMCECARTFAAVVSAVDFDKDEPVWDGVPDTCWRKR